MARGARTIAIQTLDLSYGGAYAAAEAAVPRFAVRAAWDQAAGFIVLLNAVEPWYLQAMRDAGRPVVLLSSEVPGFVCPVARPDNRTGVTQAVAHLVAHGHRRIAFAGSFIQSDIRERLDAYREALTLNGIEPDDALVFEADDNLAVGGEAAARRMLAAGLPSTAVIAGTDYNALAIMGALSEAGLSLPDDQAIVGFDDVEAGASARPTLSTIHQRFDETAGLAADLLLDLIAGEEVASGDHRLPSLFVPREFLRLQHRLDGRGDDRSLGSRDRDRQGTVDAAIGASPGWARSIPRAAGGPAQCRGAGRRLRRGRRGLRRPAEGSILRSGPVSVVGEPALDHHRLECRLPAPISGRTDRSRSSRPRPPGVRLGDRGLRGRAGRLPDHPRGGHAQQPASGDGAGPRPQHVTGARSGQRPDLAGLDRPHPGARRVHRTVVVREQDASRRPPSAHHRGFVRARRRLARAP